MAFSITKIGECEEVRQEAWKAYNEGTRIQAECSHKNALAWRSKRDGVERLTYVCDDCHKIWSESP